MKSRFLFTVLITSFVVGAGTSPIIAEELTLFAGDTLQVSFYLPQVPTPSLNYDMFYLGSANSVVSISPDFSTVDVRLFDGNHLLGTYSRTAYPLPALFETDDSLWDNGQNPTIIDFTSFLDGSIDGKLLLTISSGYFSFESSRISVGMGHATGSSSYAAFLTDQPIITDISIEQVNTPQCDEYKVLLAPVSASEYSGCEDLVVYGSSGTVSAEVVPVLPADRLSGNFSPSVSLSSAELGDVCTACVVLQDAWWHPELTGKVNVHVATLNITVGDASGPLCGGIPVLMNFSDADGDGIPDPLDVCPDVYGEKIYDGCPTSHDDIDGDGIPNEEDECPTEFGYESNEGCPRPSAVHRPASDIELEASNIGYQGLRFGSQYYIYMGVYVTNRGFETAENFDVRFNVSGFGVRSFSWRTVHVDSIDPGQSVWVYAYNANNPESGAFKVSPGPFGEVYTLKAVVDYHNKINEWDESNNVYQTEVFLKCD